MLWLSCRKYDLSKAIEAFLTYELVMNTWGCLHLFLDSFVSTEDLSSTNERVRGGGVDCDRLAAPFVCYRKRSPFLKENRSDYSLLSTYPKEEPIRIGISL